MDRRITKDSDEFRSKVADFFSDKDAEMSIYTDAAKSRLVLVTHEKCVLLCAKDSGLGIGFRERCTDLDNLSYLHSMTLDDFLQKFASIFGRLLTYGQRMPGAFMNFVMSGQLGYDLDWHHPPCNDYTSSRFTVAGGQININKKITTVTGTGRYTIGPRVTSTAVLDPEHNTKILGFPLSDPKARKPFR